MTAYIVYRNGLEVARFKRAPRVFGYLCRIGKLGSEQERRVMGGETINGWSVKKV